MKVEDDCMPGWMHKQHCLTNITHGAQTAQIKGFKKDRNSHLRFHSNNKMFPYKNRLLVTGLKLVHEQNCSFL